MPKTEAAKAMDALQWQLRPLLKEHGFRMHARTCNRETSDGLTHVINFQMGRSDPPVAYEIPSLRTNVYGKFTVNVGIYVPEVATVLGLPARAYVQEPYCCVRRRLSHLECRSDRWWDLPANQYVAADLRLRFERDAFPFLAEFGDRHAVLRQLESEVDTTGGPPRISRAIILAHRGESEKARQLLIQQFMGATQGHAKHVQEIADRLKLGELNPSVRPC